MTATSLKLLSTNSALVWEVQWITGNPQYYDGSDHQVQVILNIIYRYRRNDLIKTIRQRRDSNGLQRIYSYCGVKGSPRR